MDDAGVFSGEFLFEVGDEAGILFDDGQAGAPALDEPGERAKARADFDDVVFGLDLEQRDDGAGEILVMEEILAEAAGGGCLQVRECVADFGKGHGQVIAFFTGIHKTDVKNGSGEARVFRKLFTVFPA